MVPVRSISSARTRRLLMCLAVHASICSFWLICPSLAQGENDFIVENNSATSVYVSYGAWSLPLSRNDPRTVAYIFRGHVKVLPGERKVIHSSSFGQTLYFRVVRKGMEEPLSFRNLKTISGAWHPDTFSLAKWYTSSTLASDTRLRWNVGPQRINYWDDFNPANDTGQPERLLQHGFEDVRYYEIETPATVTINDAPPIN